MMESVVFVVDHPRYLLRSLLAISLYIVHYCSLSVTFVIGHDGYLLRSLYEKLAIWHFRYLPDLRIKTGERGIRNRENRHKKSTQKRDKRHRTLVNSLFELNKRIAHRDCTIFRVICIKGVPTITQEKAVPRDESFDVDADESCVPKRIHFRLTVTTQLAQISSPRGKSDIPSKESENEYRLTDFINFFEPTWLGRERNSTGNRTRPHYVH